MKISSRPPAPVSAAATNQQPAGGAAGRAGDGTAGGLELDVGEVVAGRVMRVEDDGRVQLAIGDRTVSARSLVALTPGSEILLEVKAGGTQPLLTLAGKKGLAQELVRILVGEASSLARAVGLVSGAAAEVVEVAPGLLPAAPATPPGSAAPPSPAVAGVPGGTVPTVGEAGRPPVTVPAGQQAGAVQVSGPAGTPAVAAAPPGGTPAPPVAGVTPAPPSPSAPAAGGVPGGPAADGAPPPSLPAPDQASAPPPAPSPGRLLSSAVVPGDTFPTPAAPSAPGPQPAAAPQPAMAQPSSAAGPTASGQPAGDGPASVPSQPAVVPAVKAAALHGPASPQPGGPALPAGPSALAPSLLDKGQLAKELGALLATVAPEVASGTTFLDGQADLGKLARMLEWLLPPTAAGGGGDQPVVSREPGRLAEVVARLAEAVASAPPHEAAGEAAVADLDKLTRLMDGVQQLNSQPPAVNQPVFLLLPCIFAGGAGWGQWLFSAGEEQGREGGERMSTVDFFLQMSRLGDLHLHLAMRREGLAGEFAVANEEVRAHLLGRLPELAALLEEFGFQPVSFTCRTTKVPLLQTVKQTLERTAGLRPFALVDVSA